MSREDQPDLEVVELMADGTELAAEPPSAARSVASDPLIAGRPLARRPRLPRSILVLLLVTLLAGGVVGFAVGRGSRPAADSGPQASAAGATTATSVIGSTAAAGSVEVFSSVPSADVQYNSGAGPCDRLATTSTQFAPSTGLVRAIGLHFPGIVLSSLSVSRYVDDDEICSADATGTDLALQVEVSLRFFGIATDGAQTATTSVLGRYTESATRNFFLERYSVSLEFSAQQADQLPTAAAVQGFIAEPLLAARA